MYINVKDVVVLGTRVNQVSAFLLSSLDVIFSNRLDFIKVLCAIASIRSPGQASDGHHEICINFNNYCKLMTTFYQKIVTATVNSTTKYISIDLVLDVDLQEHASTLYMCFFINRLSYLQVAVHYRMVKSTRSDSAVIMNMLEKR